jgi:hypothetical protein
MAQDSILVHLSRLIHSAPTDSSRKHANEELTKALLKNLDENPRAARTIPDSVLSVSFLVAPDESFRLLSWMVPAVDRSRFTYYGLLQRFDKKTGRDTIHTLHEASDTLSNPESAKLRDDAWIGCVWYDMIPRKKGGKMYYVLLGWKGRNTLTTQKVIDVLSFQSKKVQFGYPLFKTGKTYKNRVLFEYTASATMSLRYEEKKKMIVFDHLSVPSNVTTGEGNMAQFTGPDGTYDAYEFKKGRWNLLKDIDIGTDWKPKKVKPVLPTPPDK